MLSQKLIWRVIKKSPIIMGQTKLECKGCGNEWTPYSGVGNEWVKQSNFKKDNTHWRCDKSVKCPNVVSYDH